jgi:Putative Na+/H+ antiporter
MLILSSASAENVARSERSRPEIRESELLTIMRVVNCLLAACLFLFGPLSFVSAATPSAPDQPKIEFPKLSEWSLLIGAVLLTAFNDNAAITYLASLVPGFSPSLKYAVMAGAVSGGGLTVIANAPNPAGQSLLAPAFGEDGIAPASLFAAALFPTIIVAVLFMILP